MNASRKKNQLRPRLEAVEGRCLTAANPLAELAAAHAPAAVALHRSHRLAHGSASARPGRAVAIVVPHTPNGQGAQEQGSVRAASANPGFNPDRHANQTDLYGYHYDYISHHNHSQGYPFYGVHHNVFHVKGRGIDRHIHYPSFA